MVFNYLAPAVRGEDFNITFGIVNATDSKETNVTIGFIDDVSPVLTNENNITINYATQSKEIAIQLVKAGIPQVGAIIKSTSISSAFGRLENISATTGSDGYARFNYIAPNVLTDGNTTVEFVYTTEYGIEIRKRVNIQVTRINATFAYAIAYETTPVIVSNTEQKIKVSAYLIDQSGVGVAGKSLKITAIDQIYGAFASSTATTDGSGKATFIYTAPVEFAGVANITASIRFTEDDITIAKPITIIIAPKISTSGYKLTNQSLIGERDENNAIEFIKPNTKYTTNQFISDENNSVEIQLVKNGIPVIDVRACSSTDTITVDCVLPVAIDRNYGRLENHEGKTKKNGYTEYIYISPALDANETSRIVNTTFPVYYIDANGKIAAEANITIDLNVTSKTTGTGVSEYSLTNQNNIVVNYPAQTQEIAVQLVKNGVPVSGESVSATSIPSSVGRIESATAMTGTDGYARFKYIAPDTLSAGNYLLRLVYRDKNGFDAEANVTISITPSPLYEFVNTSDIKIYRGSEKQDIKTQLIYKGVPIAGKTVSMKAFDDENGSLISNYSVTTDGLGYATFTFMATETLDEVNGTTMFLTMQFEELGLRIQTQASIYFEDTTKTIVEDITLPIVVIPANQRVITINSNSATVEISVKVFKDIAPYTTGNVKVELPSKVLDGTDVGQFNAYSVAIDGLGIAKFTYTGPSNLQSLINQDDNSSIFYFYHEGNYKGKQPMKIVYKQPAIAHISRNYELDIITSGEFSMGIPNKEKTFNVLLKARDASGKEVPLENESISRIDVTTANGTIAQILNTQNGIEVDTLSIATVNNSSFILKSKTLSGLVPLEVAMEFIDTNGDEQNLSTIVNVRVFSGPPSAISISYVGTSQDKERAKYTEKLAISVTDEYGNEVNTQPNISLGAIVGYAVDGKEASNKETSATRRLFYGKAEIDAGSADGVIDDLGDGDVSTTHFEDTTAGRENLFRYVNAEGNFTDKLVIFGERKNYEAMGKWDITKIDNRTLALEDQYYGIFRDGLYYAVGHNYYQDLCREDGREWIGNAASETYQLDLEGTVVVDYKYDYHLTGKDALVWVNLDGIQPDTGKKTRVGEAVKHTLRGVGFTSVPASYSVGGGAGASANVTFTIWHKDAPEHYRNAKFGFDIPSGTTCNVAYIGSSNDYDARSCYGTYGSTYVTLKATVPNDKTSCTIGLDGERIMVSSEF